MILEVIQILNINLNLGGNRVTNSNDILENNKSKSPFADVNGTTTNADVLSLLDKYENTNNPNQQYLYSNTDLNSVLTSNNGCEQLNINEYTSNRISNCNCKL